MIKNHLLAYLQIALSLENQEEIEFFLKKIPHFYFNILIVEGIEKKNEILVKTLLKKENLHLLNKKSLFQALMPSDISYNKFPEVVDFLKSYYNEEQNEAKNFIDENLYPKNVNGKKIGNLFVNSIEITGGSFSVFLKVAYDKEMEFDNFYNKNPDFINTYIKWVNELSLKINDKVMYKDFSAFKKETENIYKKEKEKEDYYQSPYNFSKYCISLIWENYFQLSQDLICKENKDIDFNSFFMLSEKMLNNISSNSVLNAKYEKILILQEVSNQKLIEKNKTKFNQRF